MKISGCLWVSLVVVVGGGAVAMAQPADGPPETEQYDDKVLGAVEPRAGGLTADGAAAAALSASPEIAAKRHEVVATRARHRRTLNRFLPRVTASASVTRVSANDVDFGTGGFSVGALNEGPLVIGACPAGGVNNCVVDAAGSPVAAVGFPSFETPRTSYRTDLGLSVPLSDYVLGLGAARRARNEELVSAETLVAVEQQRVALRARIAYYEWLRTVAQKAVTERSLAATNARLGDARLGLQGGTLTPADVLQIESAVASAQVVVNSAISLEELARADLALLMGAAGNQFSIGENLLDPVEPLGSLGSLTELIQRAQRERKEVRALEALLRANHAAHEGLKSNLYPRLDGVANVTYANPNPQAFPPEAEWKGSWSVGLQLSWDLSGYLDTGVQRTELDTQARISSTQIDVLRRAIASEVTAAWAAWQRAESALVLQQKALEAAEAAYQQRVLLFQAGETTTTTIVEAEVQRHNATLATVNTRVDLRIARVRLLHAIAGKPADSGP